MVDIYHLFKLGTSTMTLLKAGNEVKDIVVLAKNLWKPVAMMGLYGMVDEACDEIVETALEKITKEKE